MSLSGCQWLVVTWRGENEAVTFGNMNVLNSSFIVWALNFSGVI